MSEMERVAEALAAGATAGLAGTVRRVVRDVSGRLLALPDLDGGEGGGGCLPEGDDGGSGTDVGAGVDGGAVVAGSGAAYHVVATGSRGVLVGDHAVQHNTFN
ncbi:hypothetical protein ACIQJX_07860 [Streptomyces griseoviridis]|uniref:hypothetical protein n=1 Tax=Streptomyces griseoviridis TaxID=45398 RepID=UPI00344217C2